MKQPTRFNLVDVLLDALCFLLLPMPVALLDVGYLKLAIEAYAPDGPSISDLSWSGCFSFHPFYLSMPFAYGGWIAVSTGGTGFALQC